MKKESQNIINLKACRSLKHLALTANDTIGELENALYEILDANTLNEAKELAADVLEEDLEIYLENEVPELDFDNDLPFEEDDMSSNFEERD